MNYTKEQYEEVADKIIAELDKASIRATYHYANDKHQQVAHINIWLGQFTSTLDSVYATVDTDELDYIIEMEEGEDK